MLLPEVPMRPFPCVFFLALMLAACGGQADAAPDGWHGSLKDGIEASAKSGKPMLVITAWKRTL